MWIIIIAICVAFDQFSKYLIVKNVEVNQDIPIIDKFFFITHTRNKGAAWGILENERFFLLSVTVIAIVLLIVMLIKYKEKVMRIALSLILGGAIGNLIDRAIHGSVVDFLDFHFGSYNYPTFNVADMCVVCGSFILLYYTVFIMKDENKDENKDGNIDDNRNMLSTETNS